MVAFIFILVCSRAAGRPDLRSPRLWAAGRATEQAGKLDLPPLQVDQRLDGLPDVASRRLADPVRHHKLVGVGYAAGAPLGLAVPFFPLPVKRVLPLHLLPLLPEPSQGFGPQVRVERLPVGFALPGQGTVIIVDRFFLTGRVLAVDLHQPRLQNLTPIAVLGQIDHFPEQLAPVLELGGAVVEPAHAPLLDLGVVFVEHLAALLQGGLPELLFHLQQLFLGDVGQGRQRPLVKAGLVGKVFDQDRLLGILGLPGLHMACQQGRIILLTFRQFGDEGA